MHELGEFVSHYGEIRSLDAVVVALSVDPVSKARLVKNELKIPFPVLSDSQMNALHLYGTGMTLKAGPQKGTFDRAVLMLVDKRGIIRWIHVSTNYKIRLPVSTDIAEIRKVQSGE